MVSTKNFTIAQWMESFGNGAQESAFAANGAIGQASSGGTAIKHTYDLNLSMGSYAVDTHAFAQQLTLARWMEMSRSGSRVIDEAVLIIGMSELELAAFALAEEELVGAL